MNDLNERIKSYEDDYDFKIIQRIPIVIKIEVRNFKRLTSELRKPFSLDIMDAMAHTLLYVVTEVSGAIFGYQKDDEINIIIRQEDDIWLQNRIQKISSISASLATLAFNRFIQALDLEDKDLIGDAVFSANTFGVSSITEAINYLISRQNDCTINAVHNAAFYELDKKYGHRTAYNMLQKKNTKTKQELLLEKCGINFEEHYPIPFIKGIAAYKAPLLKDSSKHKWVVDLEIPSFLSNKEWIENIFRSGRDIFRARDFE